LHGETGILHGFPLGHSPQETAFLAREKKRFGLLPSGCKLHCDSPTKKCPETPNKPQIPSFWTTIEQIATHLTLFPVNRAFPLTRFLSLVTDVGFAPCHDIRATFGKDQEL
jgi:hypothetical protein